MKTWKNVQAVRVNRGKCTIVRLPNIYGKEISETIPCPLGAYVNKSPGAHVSLAPPRHVDVTFDRSNGYCLLDYTKEALLCHEPRERFR